MLWLIRHAMCALYPRTEHFPGLEDLGVTEYLRRYRRESTFLMWLGLFVGAWLFAWTPWMTVYVPLPSFLLPKGLLDKHARKITGTRIYLLRQMIFLVKLGAGTCWAIHPRVREKVGLAPYGEDPGTFRTEKTIRRLQIHKDDGVAPEAR
ncbi:hypothetical protein BAC2_02540 [uncultured bacterium]|nr:hypothetical protein [Sandaracinaceae bacterium]CAG1772480.1 hypothetical protein BAC2_02540 [uncultured bacterium]